MQALKSDTHILYFSGLADSADLTGPPLNIKDKFLKVQGAIIVVTGRKTTSEAYLQP